MMLSIIVFGRKYKLSKYLSVFTITLGIILCTLASSKNIVSSLSGQSHGARLAVLNERIAQ